MCHVVQLVHVCVVASHIILALLYMWEWGYLGPIVKDIVEYVPSPDCKAPVGQHLALACLKLVPLTAGVDAILFTFATGVFQPVSVGLLQLEAVVYKGGCHVMLHAGVKVAITVLGVNHVSSV